MQNPIELASPELVCFHEAGHAFIALAVGAEVVEMELYRATPRSYGRTNVNRTDEQRELIVLGGFAAEYLLFRAGRLRKPDGSLPSEKEFIDEVFDNALADPKVKINSIGLCQWNPCGALETGDGGRAALPAVLGRIFMQADLTEHLCTLGVTAEGIDYVRRAAEAPSRLVGKGHFLNVSTRFASSKVGETIQAESHTCELPFVHQCELRHDVIMYYDQPPKLFVERMGRSGRLYRGTTTPDFLVVTREEVLIYECKTSSDLKKKADKEPHSWIKDTSGYRFIPGEKAASELGFRFVVHSADSISAIQAANMKMLINLQRSMAAPLNEKLLARALRWMHRRQALTIQELADRLKLDSVTPILASVLAGQLHSLLRWQLLSNPLHTCVFATEVSANLAEQALTAMAVVDPLAPQDYRTPIAISSKALKKASDNAERIQQIRDGSRKPSRQDC
jgi:hypothetical protein